MYSKDGKTLYNVTGSAKEYRIKDSVENIGEYAFNSNDTIRSVTMSDSVKNIGRYAFANMEKLSPSGSEVAEKIGGKHIFQL